MDVSGFCTVVFGEIFKIWNIMSVVFFSVILSSSLSSHLSMLSYCRNTLPPLTNEPLSSHEPNKLRISPNETRIVNVRIPLCIAHLCIGWSQYGFRTSVLQMYTLMCMICVALTDVPMSIRYHYFCRCLVAAPFKLFICFGP